MNNPTSPDITEIIGNIPNRIALAGGWIDQPFVSKHNPDPWGSMVVASLEPSFRVLDRSGMATSTRKIAHELWNGRLPGENPEDLVRQLYKEENRDKEEPSGSQDMIGLVYPGISRLDYSFTHEGGYFPGHVESCNDPGIARWLESVFSMVPLAPRPDGYNPLGVKNLSPEWIQKLGRTGKDCFSSIIEKDLQGLGRSMNLCMECWEAILPRTVVHPAIKIDLKKILHYYQARYTGAMYSGCGGGYIFVVSDEPVPGSLKVTIRVNED